MASITDLFICLPEKFIAEYKLSLLTDRYRDHERVKHINKEDVCCIKVPDVAIFTSRKCDDLGNP